MSVKRKVMKIIIKDSLSAFVIFIILLLLIYKCSAILEGDIAPELLRLRSEFGIETYYEYSTYLIIFAAINIYSIWVNLDIYIVSVNYNSKRCNIASSLIPIILFPLNILFLIALSQMWNFDFFDSVIVILCISINLLNILFYLYIFLHAKDTASCTQLKKVPTIESINLYLLQLKNGAFCIFLLFIFFFSEHAVSNKASESLPISIIIIFIFSLMTFLLQLSSIVYKLFTNSSNNNRMCKDFNSVINQISNLDKDNEFIDFFIIIKQHCFKIANMGYFGNLTSKSINYNNLIKEVTTENKKVKIHYITESLYESIPNEIVNNKTVIVLCINVVLDKFLNNCKEIVIIKYLSHLKKCQQMGVI